MSLCLHHHPPERCSFFSSSPSSWCQICSLRSSPGIIHCSLIYLPVRCQCAFTFTLLRYATYFFSSPISWCHSYFFSYIVLPVNGVRSNFFPVLPVYGVTTNSFSSSPGSWCQSSFLFSCFPGTWCQSSLLHSFSSFPGSWCQNWNLPLFPSP